MMGDQNQFDTILGMLAEAMSNNAQELAEAQYTYFEELQEAGFSEEQALELVQDLDVGGD